MYMIHRGSLRCCPLLCVFPKLCAMPDVLCLQLFGCCLFVTVLGHLAPFEFGLTPNLL